MQAIMGQLFDHAAHAGMNASDCQGYAAPAQYELKRSGSEENNGVMLPGWYIRPERCNAKISRTSFFTAWEMATL